MATTVTIPLFRPFLPPREELMPALEQVLYSGQISEGQPVYDFEAGFGKWLGNPRILSFYSGTAALHTALILAGVTPGDEVISTPMTAEPTNLAILHAGGKVVWADVDQRNGNMCAKSAESLISPRTKAILVVHYGGIPVDLAAFRDLGKRHGIAIIEDAAQAHGALHAGRRAGSFGELAAFSFYPGKNLGAYGDGGAVVTSDPILHDRLQLLRNFGSPSKYRHETLGYNSRLDTIQAAVLRVKLAMLDRWNGRRAEIAKRYDVLLADHPGIELTSYRDGSVYHLYVVRVADRDRVLNTLQAEGIGAGIHYPCALHELGAFADLGYSSGAFPVAEDWGRRCLSLPMDPSMSNEAIERCAAGLIAAVSST